LKNHDEHHPSHDIIGTHGIELLDKKIVLCISGSVAAYKAIELARLLIRRGAKVICVMSRSATKLISAQYLKWATGNSVITELGGELEHIKLADYKKSDCIIVYPATANIIGKLANGISDSILSTMLMVGLGSNTPIFMALAMHESMYNNIAVTKNIEFLNKKVNIIESNIIENKAKILDPEKVVRYIIKKIAQKSILTDKYILVTAGSTIEYIDPIKIITNNSTGKTGLLLAKEMADHNANVTLIYAHGSEKPPDEVKTIRVNTTDEMFDAIKHEMQHKKMDVIVLAAAVSDYKPSSINKSKIKSTKINLKLGKTVKIIDHIKKIQNDVFLVGFKAEACVSKNILVEKAKQKMTYSNSDMIVANDIGTTNYRTNSDYNDVTIIDNKSIVNTGWTTKSNIVKTIVKIIMKNMTNK